MVRRFVIKVIVFTLIVSYFIFYKFNDDSHLSRQAQVTHLTTLLLQEQQLLKELNILEDQFISIDIVDQFKVPYVEGKLVSLSQLTEHIVLAKVKVTHAHNINLKVNQTIEITYTGFKDDELAPIVNNQYRWLVQQSGNKNEYYFIQGGLKGIIAY